VTIKYVWRAIFLICLPVCNACANGLEVVELIDGREIKVQLFNSVPLSGSCSGWRWGAEGVCPTMQISEITIDVDGKEIFIPRSAYSDLAAPTKIKLLPGNRNRGFDLIISGGDAALAFQAILSFSFNRILQRKVFSMEFKDKAWEQTRYSFP